MIDSQSVKPAETVAAGERGYDAGKKINGRKRHIAIDTRAYKRLPAHRATMVHWTMIRITSRPPRQDAGSGTGSQTGPLLIASDTPFPLLGSC